MTDAESLISCPLRCQCGRIQATLFYPHLASRVVCYCRTCQAFAHHLGQAQMLDPWGGTDLFQVLPRDITFIRGAGDLACLRLKPTGLLRWYAFCCGTPIGNTLVAAQLSFIALARPFLSIKDPSLEEVFGPVTAALNVAGARAVGGIKPREVGSAKVAAWLLSTVARARLNGDYKQTPFFDPHTGEPVATPYVLGAGELASALDAVRSHGRG